MGLFDTYVAWADCPHCGKYHEFRFQTKALGGSMNTFNLGAEVQTGISYHKPSDIIMGVFDGLDDCKEKTKKTKGKKYYWVYADILITQGKFTGIEGRSSAVK